MDALALNPVVDVALMPKVVVVVPLLPVRVMVVVEEQETRLLGVGAAAFSPLHLAAPSVWLSS